VAHRGIDHVVKRGRRTFDADLAFHVAGSDLGSLAEGRGELRGAAAPT
jgi:hypothetical protein